MAPSVMNGCSASQDLILVSPLTYYLVKMPGSHFGDGQVLYPEAIVVASYQDCPYSILLINQPSCFVRLASLDSFVGFAAFFHYLLVFVNWQSLRLRSRLYHQLMQSPN